MDKKLREKASMEEEKEVERGKRKTQRRGKEREDKEAEKSREREGRSMTSALPDARERKSQ